MAQLFIKYVSVAPHPTPSPHTRLICVLFTIPSLLCFSISSLSELLGFFPPFLGSLEAGLLPTMFTLLSLMFSRLGASPEHEPDLCPLLHAYTSLAHWG